MAAHRAYSLPRSLGSTQRSQSPPWFPASTAKPSRISIMEAEGVRAEIERCEDRILAELPPECAPGSEAFQSLVKHLDYICSGQLVPDRLKYTASILLRFKLAGPIEDYQHLTLKEVIRLYEIACEMHETMDHCDSWNLEEKEIPWPEGEPEDCPICTEPLNHFIATKCKHKFHYMCLLQAWSQKHECPMCRAGKDGKPPPAQGETDEPNDLHVIEAIVEAMHYVEARLRQRASLGEVNRGLSS